MSVAKENDKVKVHYTGTLSDGEIFDSSEGREPLEFTIGGGQVIPGFEQGVLGMSIDEEKTINIPKAEAYGDANPQLIQEVPREHLPADLKPEVGMQLISQSPDGQKIPIVITEVKETTITVDANHPMAGKDLTFKLKLVEIEG